MTFNEQSFLDWLDEIDGYYVEQSRIKEEWPQFYEHYELGPVTSKYDPETEEIETPIRDFRQTIVYGQPLD